ncbi:MAG TPA: PD-(D/E)XK nuclease family protein [Flavobacterium sp.]|jgi:hypothetical protein
MEENAFLDKLAYRLLNDYQKLDEVVVVLPSRRAKVFLTEALRKQSSGTIFSPLITNIEEFISSLAGIRSIDSTEQLFEFYEVYRNLTEPDKQQKFDIFANWAKMLIQDFNEIDRYLLQPRHVLSYLKDIEDIKHWSLDIENRTTLIENHLRFWDLLPAYYENFYAHLKRKGIGYQGLIYREAVANIDHFSAVSGGKSYVFAGFNALNAAEEKIMQHLVASDAAKIYWDADLTFLEDSHHDAGLFIRRFKNTWNHYKANPFEWVFDNFAQEKNISIIGTPKSIGQAKMAGNILNKLITENNVPLNKVAIILGDENLLVPLLYSLPNGLPGLNITMGYPAKNNPVQVLMTKLFRMHTAALSRNAQSYVMYYKDVLDVLTHPLVEPFADTTEALQTIKQNNYTFITHSRLMGFFKDSDVLPKLLFNKWEKGPQEVLDRLSDLLIEIKNNLSGDNEQEKITKAFVYAVFKVINKLASYFSVHAEATGIDTLHAIYKQVIDLAEVSFEGEPLDGLQIMGVLESRVLDFETIIITSMNEGKFPAGKSQNSFIPSDVKRELGLPTFKEKDAIYTYHFYHLMQRAKNIYLLYNTESDGLDGGERSRFITQLEVEKQPAHQLSHEIYNPHIPEVKSAPITIEKSAKVMARLKEIAEDGFSPSALTSYIRNPIDFYFRKILRIRETEEVEENIAVNTLGTIIHETLRVLYEPLVGEFLSEADIINCMGRIDAEVSNQFRIIYREGEITKGRNLLAFEVAKRHVLNFLKTEINAIKNGELVKILYLEQRFERVLDHPELTQPVKIGGTVDRIEERDGVIRIIDYKTGKVEARALCLDQWEGLTSDIKNDKIIQVLAYAFMIGEQWHDKKAEAGIISFKNMKNGFLPFEFKGELRTSLLNADILEQYKIQLVRLLNEIFDENIPFTEKV